MADFVAPLTYAVATQQSGYVMRGYKARPPVAEHYGVVAVLLLVALSDHVSCVGKLAGTPVTHWSSVPSLPATSSEHPLRRIIAGVAPGLEVPLRASQTPANPRAMDASNFRAQSSLPANSHVLLVDDTWTSGGHVQSAVLALRDAGAAVVSVMVAARWIRPDFGENMKFLKERCTSDYDPRICPWTGGACP